jgi:hypothetical protein
MSTILTVSCSGPHGWHESGRSGGAAAARGGHSKRRGQGVGAGEGAAGAGAKGRLFFLSVKIHIAQIAMTQRMVAAKPFSQRGVQGMGNVSAHLS